MRTPILIFVLLVGLTGTAAFAQDKSAMPESGYQLDADAFSDENDELHGDTLTDLSLNSGRVIVMGKTILPGTSTRLAWEPEATFESIAAPTPVLVLNGVTPGPTLCMTGAVHGDEINGIEIIRQVFFGLDPQKISGTIIGVPIVNQMGFRRGSRYLPDRRDLNRYFPGNRKGSSASRIAHSFFNDVILRCDALIDIHTGSFHRTNTPQLRADMRNPGVIDFVRGFAGMVVLHSVGAKGSLRRAAVEAGIPAVTIEVGEPMRIQSEVVTDGVAKIGALLSHIGITKRPYVNTKADPVYFNSRWVRVNQGGLLLSDVQVGKKISKGDILGVVIDPITNLSYHIFSPYNGQVLGMALNQVVMPGYAAYHIGIGATEKSIELSPGPDETDVEIDEQEQDPLSRAADEE